MPSLLLKRDSYDYDSDPYYDRNVWDDWVRWLILGLIIAGGIALFVAFSCISARRRRRAGFNAYPMTGWALGRTPPGHAPPQYYHNQGAAAPPYSAQDTTTPYYAPPPTYDASANAKDYGAGSTPQHQTQQQESYAPPAGPPPAHTAAPRM